MSKDDLIAGYVPAGSRDGVGGQGLFLTGPVCAVPDVAQIPHCSWPICVSGNAYSLPTQSCFQYSWAEVRARVVSVFTGWADGVPKGCIETSVRFKASLGGDA